MNKWVLSKFLKAVNGGAVRMSGGKLFHAVGPEMQNAETSPVYEAQRDLHGLNLSTPIINSCWWYKSLFLMSYIKFFL